jgi:hypothetical protein
MPIGRDDEYHLGAGAVPTVVLPCPPDQFRDFIAGLLGRPQTIENEIDGPFEIKMTDVENLFHLLEQRVSSQNEATLVQFTARIVYDDDSSVLLSSFADFSSYKEVKPLVSTGLHLTWTYLIKFRVKAFPEKQTVQISFQTDREPRFIELSETFRIARAFGRTITIRIEHTDRTWGTDIEALLKGQLQLFQQSVGRCRKLVTTHAGKIGFLAASIGATIALVIAYQITNNYSLQYLAKAQELKTRVASFEIVARQIDFLTNLIAAGTWTRFAVLLTFFLLITAVGSVIMGAVVGEHANIRTPSFILLTSKAEASKKEAINKLENSWYILAGWLTGTLGLGVVSNALFYFGLKYWGPGN